MGDDRQGHLDSLDHIRSELARRLRARRPELQEGIFARVRETSELPQGAEHAEYVTGLREAVVEALDYALRSIEDGEDFAAPIPIAAASQARRAARHGVSLDTVLRRYAAGDRQLVELIMDEATDFPSQAVRHLLRGHGVQVDRFMAAVAADYEDELERMTRSPERWVAECVEKLLAGKPVDTARLSYAIEERWHLGLIGIGADVTRTIKGLAQAIDRDLLFVKRSDDTVWAWLGGARRLPPSEVERHLVSDAFADASFAIGEPSRGLDGWRLTHRQAQAAMWVALRKPRRVTRYADDPLLAAALRDEVLARSLNEIYCLPLCGQRDGGAVLRETLRAYFAAERNAATAAALLRVDRHTVQRRLRKIEERLGRLLHTCYAELEVALRLQELNDPGHAASLPSTRLATAQANGSVRITEPV